MLSKRQRGSMRCDKMKKYIIDFLINGKKVNKIITAPTQEQALKKKVFTANNLLAIGEVEVREVK